MIQRSRIRSASAALLATGLFSLALHAQDSTRRGRKYKAPPATSHIEIAVLKGYNGKPVPNAAVIFHAVRDGKDEGNLEVKTNDEGKASIDVIATGSAVDVQVIAEGFATYAGQYQIDEPTREIAVKMERPQAQISAYTDNHGRASDRTVGVQESARPSTAPVIEPAKPTNHTSDPDSRTPVDKDATPGNTQNGLPGNPPGVPPQL